MFIQQIKSPLEINITIQNVLLKSTRLVAVCLETHCNIGSKRAFTTIVLNRWHNCLLIYWRTSCSVPAFNDT